MKIPFVKFKYSALQKLLSKWKNMNDDGCLINSSKRLKSWHFVEKEKDSATFILKNNFSLKNMDII